VNSQIKVRERGSREWEEEKTEKGKINPIWAISSLQIKKAQPLHHRSLFIIKSPYPKQLHLKISGPEWRKPKTANSLMGHSGIPHLAVTEPCTINGSSNVKPHNFVPSFALTS
jgi:hypothetical protein